ncbi:sensor histidine kinase [Microbacterium halophytorum]|uniref:sensor histidine kinase n=1 Tax=Microbacterium halophytorum TaxID=2067568 RepID=UPI001E414C79|nr:ATP-binding protein [Microbacterium halophytorum]
MSTSRRFRMTRAALLVLPSVIVLAAVGSTTAIAITEQRSAIRDATAARVVDVADGLAGLDQVVDALDGMTDRAAATAALQPMATLVERTSGVDYVVVIAPDGNRVTHPTPAERGRPVSTDSDRVLAGEDVLEIQTGTIGRTLRAKRPVLDDSGAVIGGVSVGMFEHRMTADYEEGLRGILPWVAAALVVGLAASAWLTAAIRRRLRQAEEDARELEHVGRTADALREQAHEFDTRMHVVRGLVANGDAAEAVEYIDGATNVVTSEPEPGLAGQPLLRAAIEALRAELGAAGTALETAIDISSPADDALTLVVGNLCRNAAEAGARHVRCEIRERGGRVHGVVDDDGPGIPPARRARMFDRGVTTKPDNRGTGRGIGLDLVRRAVTRRGGTVEVSESPMGGARFAFDMGARS